MLLVTGASGFLGSALAREAVAAGLEVAGTYHRNRFDTGGVRMIRVDLGDPSAVRPLLSQVKPDWVVNCAAFTNVDECEGDPIRARQVNSEIPRALAAGCAEAGIQMLQVSTDSVFDGKRGRYSEADSSSPLNVYAQTKLEGERAVLDELADGLVIRTNFIGLSPGRASGLADWLANRFERGERVPGFTDVVFAPLLVGEVARTALEMMKLALRGVYHVCASDSVSKYEFACLLGEALGFNRNMVDPTSLAAAGLRAPRPMNTSMSPRRAEIALGHRLPEVGVAIASYARLRGANASMVLNPATEA